LGYPNGALTYELYYIDYRPKDPLLLQLIPPRFVLIVLAYPTLITKRIEDGGIVN